MAHDYGHCKACGEQLQNNHYAVYGTMDVSAVRLWTWGGDAICEQGHTLKEAVTAALDRLDAGKISDIEPDQDF